MRTNSGSLASVVLRLKRHGALLLGGLLPLAACGDEEKRAVAKGDVEIRVIDAAEEQRMLRYVDGMRPSSEKVLHRFTLDAGDTVDCVDLYAQPALRGSKDAMVELKPAGLPEDEMASLDGGPQPETLLDGSLDSLGRPRQCPQGAIPIRRLSVDELRRFRTVDDFRRKVASHLEPQGSVFDWEPPALGSTARHQYAWTQSSVANWGAETRVNLWQPYVEKTSEFSLSQMWISRGSGANLETVEVGVQKYQDKYGDGTPRLFIYFTPDNYISGGCYNLDCTAFVQTNGTIVLGGPFANYSTSGGAQHEFQVLWYKDGTTGHWWLRYFNTWLGYYPRSLFDSAGLSDQAGSIAFGGEIIDDEPAYHTATDMGSGAWPSAGWQHAAYQRTIRYVNTSNFYADPGALPEHRTDANCYDIATFNDPGNWGRYFFFGGPGYNTNCQ